MNYHVDVSSTLVFTNLSNKNLFLHLMENHIPYKIGGQEFGVNRVKVVVSWPGRESLRIDLFPT